MTPADAPAFATLMQRLNAVFTPLSELAQAAHAQVSIAVVVLVAGAVDPDCMRVVLAAGGRGGLR